ncbi:MAG: hypothetical protein Ct9H90mP4_10560 [Gammaproteobacteria bacterium]|nr:MAG: hypothetical protein Ct9H90mP4_10560 [Gammaproteobacteria bacterium]
MIQLPKFKIEYEYFKWSAIGLEQEPRRNWLEIFYPKDLINLDSNSLRKPKIFTDVFETR